MATKNESVKLSLINVQEFVDFLKKFASQEQNILLEIRCNDKVVIRITSPEKANIVKVGEINFNDIFMTEDEDNNETILLGLYNINNFINTFTLLDESKIDIEIFYEKNKKNENISKKVSIITESLNYHFANAPRESFKYLEDAQVDMIFNTEDSVAFFEIDNKFLSKINKLINNEASRVFTVSADKKEGLYFKGKQFELKVGTKQKISDKISHNISKQYLNTLDKDGYNVFFVEKGLIFKSTNSNVMIAIAREMSASETMEHEDMEII